MSTQNTHPQVRWQRATPHPPENEHLIYPPLQLLNLPGILGVRATLHPMFGELQIAHAFCCDGEPNPCITPDTYHVPYGFYIDCTVNIYGIGEYRWKSRVCPPIPLARDVPAQRQARQGPAQQHGHAPENNRLKRNYEDTDYPDATGRKIPRTDWYAATVEREHREEVYGVGSEESATGDETVEANEESGEEYEEYYWGRESSVEVEQCVNERDSSDDESLSWDVPKAMEKAKARRGLVYSGIFPSLGNPEDTLFYGDWDQWKQRWHTDALRTGIWKVHFGPEFRVQR
ncbi:uncharacterized protein J4E79_001464 [Alternaria viburni]|uniref:uncharacterized protein n=1 Tax=Alternaria viburni TaxID=566460 RepID=UPI0020C409F4|nr:uncharacterized protein J4E79_001464 [Alternaria viburni]KAI4669421.1 hypothetical protein J4E79_001464 [Alternaria viburni]